MSRDDHALAAEHRGQNFLAIIAENPGHRIPQAFPARRPHIVGTAPEVHLFVAPSPDCIVFIEAAKHAIIALVEGSIALGLEIRRAEFGENQLQSMPRADEIGREGAIEGKSVRLEAFPGRACLRHALASEIWVFPTSEKVLEVPIALAVAHEHENAIHVSTLLDVCVWQRLSPLS